MSLRFFKSRRRIGALGLAAIACAVVVGAAYSFTSRASAGRDTPPAESDALRADFTARLTALGQTDLVPAPSSSFTTLQAAVSGKTWSFSTYRNAAGDECRVEQYPGGSRGYGCRSRAALFGGTPLFAGWGSSQNSDESRESGRWDAVWVAGVATDEVASVTLVLSDCSTLPLALSADRSFLAVIGPGNLHAGVLPYRVEAKNTAGTTIVSRSINLGPPSSKAGDIGEPPAVAAKGC